MTEPDPLGDYEPIREQVPSRVSPIDSSAEVAILSAVLASQSLFDDLDSQLTADDFGVPAHRDIFAAIMACDAAGRQFDLITVADEMRRAGSLNRSGGVDYLNRVSAAAPHLDALSGYVAIVKDRSLRRRMARAARSLGEAALDPGRAAVDALDAAEQVVFDLGHDSGEGGAPAMSKVVGDVLNEMAVARTAKIVGHSSGIDELDKVTGGFRGGQLIVIGARPGMGKSVLALQIARHIAEVTNLAVPFLSYEMTQAELGFRMLSSASGIPLPELLRGFVPSGMDRVMAHEAEKMAELPLILEDHPPATISAARSYVRRMARRAPLGAIFIDYIQLQSGDGNRRDENRTQEVSTISRTWKTIAKELNVPVFAVAQLNRGLESRPNKRPLLSDLRESGAIEQDANLILFLYRDYVYNKGADEAHAELIIAKNRQGPQATIPLDWEGACVRFKNTQRKLEPAGFGGFGGGAGAANPVSFW